MTQEGADHERRYIYVDVHYEKDADGRNIRTRWRRVRIDQIDEACRAPANNYNCFATIQRFHHRRHEAGEPAWMDLFFDLDADDLEAARQDAIKLVTWFADAGLDRPQVRVWFSGNRGFHITVSAYALGAASLPDLHQVYKLWSRWLVELLGLTTLDPIVYSARRMWRLPDSLHHKSGLFKVELSHAELQGNIEAIRSVAHQPRGSLYDDLDLAALAEQSPCDVLADLHAGFVEDWTHYVDLRRLKPAVAIAATDTAPVCVRFLLDRDYLPRVGTGHYAMLALASWYKDAGRAMDECLAALVPWACSLKNISNPGSDREITAEVHGVVRSAYESGEVAFACAFIRALGSDTERVACDHRRCATATEEAQTPKEPVVCHLSEASRACYRGLPVQLDVVVSGKDTAPYLIPRKIAVRCAPNPDKRARCKDCPLAPFGGHYEWEIPPDHPVIMEFIGVSSKTKFGILQRLLQVPQQCRDASIREIDSYNVEDVRLVAALTEFEGGGAGHHVVRRGFHVGHGIETNTPYRIVARTLAEPRSQYAVHLFHEAELVRDDALQFTVTDEVVDDLSVFQLAREQSVWDKFAEIHRDLAANVHRIWDRHLMAFALDVCWHSVLQFEFHGQLHPRGWVETFVLGDSGQGKTEMATRLRDWYGAGEWITGEDAGRTGLTYSLQQTQNRWFLAWGIIPLSDGRLVLIDEFSGLPPDEFDRMSGLRSSGILRVHRVISDSTWARCRIIYLSNPSSGRALGTYSYGAEALKELIPKAEDIRRIDIVVAVKSGEVLPDVVNRWDVPTQPLVYASDLCSKLVMWAWSRKPDDVRWMDDAMRLCLSESTEMAGRYWPDPPIVEPADQRLKIARIATAAAARTFSTPDGKTLVVEPRHVEFAVRLMDECYATRGLRYDVLSAEAIARNLADPDERDIVKSRFMQLPAWRDLVRRLLRMAVFTRSDLQEQLDLSQAEATQITKFMASRDLVRKVSRGYVKEPGFISLLHEIALEVQRDEQETFDFGENQS